ncbi:thioredoxin family protein [Haloferula rosea]|uniref:Thioredoxin family protein n=1 Tax=Haloferula rosea TaxID=490093 RepID=A0A934RF72_9BACT|nr:thioredoxin family protein [Haloferula rosea]MBK1828523.1 thioredoxin family protein [Haloferula rosea]
MNSKRILLCLCGLVPAVLLLVQCDKIPKFGEAGGTTVNDSGEQVRDIEATDFDSFTAIKGKLVVVDFHADWCGPCKTLGPKLKTISAEFGDDVVVGKINVDDAKNLASRLGVSGIPDVRLFRDGSQVDRFVGDIPGTLIRSKFQAQVTLLEMAEKRSEDPDAEAPAEEPIQRMNKDWMPEGLEKR